MDNTIKIYRDESYSVSVTASALDNLKRYAPKGCPFDGYSMADLLSDWVKMYSWKIGKGVMQITDFICLLQKENYAHAVVYGNAMIKLIESTEN